MSSAWYNIVVVGTQLGGLVYAALAARVGYRVAVLGQGAGSNLYRHEGRVFMRRPERLYGFKTSPVIARVFSELSLAMEMKNRPQVLDPIFQVAQPGMRLDVTTDRPRWARELARELPGQDEALLRFEHWARESCQAADSALGGETLYPPRGLRGRMAYRRTSARLLDGRSSASALATIRRDPRINAVIEGPIRHLSGLSQTPLSPLLLARLWTHLRAGLFQLPEGIDGLKAMFLRVVREQCGDYRAADAVKRVVMRRGRVREVELAARGESLGCELLVCNMEPSSFFQLLPAERRLNSYLTRVGACSPVALRVVFNVAVDPEVLPAGMARELLLVQDPARELVGANNLWVSRPGVTDLPARESRPGKGVLMVSAALPVRGIGATVGAVKRLESEVISSLTTVVPWLRGRIQSVHTPALRLDPRSEQIQLDPRGLEPLFAQSMPGTLGMGQIPMATPCRNLILSGDSPFGGLGLEGAFLGALQALALTRQTHRLKTTLR